MKRHLKWLIPVIALLVIGILAAVFAFPPQEEEQPSVEPKEKLEIYWNLDAEKYSGEDAETRIPSEGRYRAAFASGGKQMDLFFTDSAMMALADSYEVMGLVVDENNCVTKVVEIHEFTGGVAAYRYYVDTFTEDTIYTNSSLSFRAQPLTLRINEDTVVYDVGSSGPLAGLPAELTHGCEITAVQNKSGVVTHIFMKPPFEKSPVYWNVKRMYNSKTKTSTRESDLVGTFTILFAVNGEQVELKCKDQKVVNTIDGYAGRCMHLEFDEDGYIIKARGPSIATGNSSTTSWYHVMELTDTGFTAEKFSGSDKGTVKTVTFSKDVQFFDVSTTGEEAGKPTTLRLHDQVHCMRDPAGDVCIVFIVARFEEAEIYWNLERQYDTKTKTTKRVPDGNGYYVYQMFYKGEQVTLRTKDKEVANLIDSRSAKCCALKVEGDVITYASNPVVAWNGKPVASSYLVTKVTKDGVLTAEKSDGSATYSAPMAEDCKVYNMTQYANVTGEETTVRVNDKIYALAGVDGLIYTVYIIGRFSDSPLYWNLDRTYDSTNKVTKRVPEADGYYYFRMLKGSKIVTVRTNSKDMASKMDSWVACGLKLSGDRVIDAYKYTQVNNYDGGSFASWFNVTEVSKTKVTAKRLLSGSKYGTVQTGQFASGYKVYDVSDQATTLGEETTLREGDLIQGFMNKQKKITVVYVIERFADVPLCWNVNKYDVVNGVSTREPAADGYYYLTMVVDGEEVVLKTKDSAIVTAIDERTTRCLGVQVEEDEIVATYPVTKTVDGLGGTFASSYKVTEVTADGKITAERTVSGKLDVQTATMAKDCGVYDVSGITGVSVKAAEVQVGDTIRGYLNANGDITTLYIIGKPAISEIYWNISRQYDSTNKVTKRTPDADGYYHITMAVLGEQKTFKTKSVDLMTQIDAVATRCVGLVLDGDVITYVYYPTWDIEGYTGGTSAAWCDIMSIEGQTYYLRKNIVSDDDYGKEHVLEIPADCTVYNGSTNVISHTGEPTTLQVGDRVYCLRNKDDVIVYVIVVDRPVGYTYTRFCEACQKDMLWHEWDGESTLTTGKHYYLAADTIQPNTCTIEKGRTNCLDLNGKTLTGTEGILRNFNIKGMLNLFDSGETGKVIANKPNASTAPVFAVHEDATFNLYGGTLTSTYSSNRAGLGIIQEGEMYMYGGVLENGECTSTKATEGGGNLEVLTNGSFYMYGGVIRGGTSATCGGNISGFGSATISLLGGTVENGTAGIAGQDLSAKNNVTVGGTIQIGEIFLYGDKLIKISDEKPLEEGASIGMAMEKPGVFTDAVDAKTAGYFHSCMFESITQNSDGKMTFVATKLCEACQKTVSWEAWDGNTAFVSGGHYYLTEDVEQTAVCNIPAGSTACLDLNGKTINGGASILRNFTIRGTFNLMDSGKTGKIIANKSNASTAPVFAVYEDATFNLYGGTLTSTYSSNRAGLGIIQQGEMYMYGGVLENGECTSAKATEGGGNLEVLTNSSFYMYGGVIRGGTSATYGGNISGFGSATISLLGGTVENGTAGIAGQDLSAKNNVTVGGTIQIGEIFLYSDKLIKISDEKPLEEGASIGIAMEKPGVFTDTVDAKIAGYFHPTTNDTLTQDATGKLTLSHVHCVCMGLDTEHTCNEAQIWEPWPADNAWESGKYYFLTSNVQEMPSIKVEAGQTLNLCLNGYDYVGADVYRLFAIYGTVNICDHKHEGTFDGTVTATYDATGKMAPVFRVYPDGVFNVYGGNFTATNEMLEAGLGAVDAATMNIYDGKFYGGSVTTTSAKQGGGNISLFKEATLVMYGGELSGGTSALNGANLFMNNATCVFKMYGGVITGGTAQYGGGVYGQGTVMLSGDATITGNTGGNLFLSGGTFVTIDGTLSGETPVGITLADGVGAFAEVGTDLTGHFVSDAGYRVVYEDGQLKIVNS